MFWGGFRLMIEAIGDSTLWPTGGERIMPAAWIDAGAASIVPHHPNRRDRPFGAARGGESSMSMDKDAVVKTLNDIMEMELAGVVRYTHYSLMVFGPYRMPVVDWLRAQATESLDHATQAGEMLTQLGQHPGLGIGPLLETHDHDLETILRESLEHERATLGYYNDLRKLVEGHSVMLEEYARQMLATEEQHLGEVDRMLRKPGDVSSVLIGLLS